jgi:hypothetical protein
MLQWSPRSVKFRDSRRQDDVDQNQSDLSVQRQELIESTHSPPFCIGKTIKDPPPCCRSHRKKSRM